MLIFWRAFSSLTSNAEISFCNSATGLNTTLGVGAFLAATFLAGAFLATVFLAATFFAAGFLAVVLRAAMGFPRGLT